MGVSGLKSGKFKKWPPKKLCVFASSRETDPSICSCRVGFAHQKPVESLILEKPLPLVYCCKRTKEMKNEDQSPKTQALNSRPPKRHPGKTRSKNRVFLEKYGPRFMTVEENRENKRKTTRGILEKLVKRLKTKLF
jgi:hypothetical protein